MSILRTISTKATNVETHVLFIHGLSGHIERTWTTTTDNSTELWPLRLEDDIPDIDLWLVGYPAAKTYWGGTGISIPERADSILALLLAESGLAGGNIIFVAHSLGGLVAKQILRNAERESGTNPRARNFLVRVKRIAFLGTPHRGALLANLSRMLWPLIRPSEVTNDLILGSSQLRDLNHWYRHHSMNNNMGNLLLSEGKPSGVFGIQLPTAIGKIVTTESADAGLPETPIPVDQDHMSICKPTNKEAEVYIHVREFIRRSFDPPLQVTRPDQVLERNTDQLQELVSLTKGQIAAFSDMRGAITLGPAMHGSHASIIDTEVDRRLERIRKCRYFSEFLVIDEVKSLVANLEGGDLAQANEEHKDTALSWCCRFLAGSDLDEAESLVNRIGTANSEVYNIARSVVKSLKGDIPDAIRELCGIGTPVAYGAAYIQVLGARGFKSANTWLDEAGLTFADLDGHGKFSYIRSALQEGSWNLAFDMAGVLTPNDWEETPGLLAASADALLLQAVPDELRETFLAQDMPFDAVKFPLRSEPLAIQHRRTAIQLYDQLHNVAKSLGLMGMAGLAEDRALWLRLVDPEYSADARQELLESVNDPSTFLRRLSLGLQFGVSIDIERAEAEVTRQTALSGGMSRDAAIARLALALSKGSHADIAAYINEHREQLFKHLDPRGLYFIEIEMLANAGQTAKAEELLEEAAGKPLSARDVARLRRELSETSGADPIAERLAAYNENTSIIELRLLVRAYEDAGDWRKACEHGKTLVEVGGDLEDVRRYVISLHNCEQPQKVITVLETYPALWSQDTDMRLLRAQTYLECGKLNDALVAVGALRQLKDSPDARHLQVSLAVVSGDWESLQGFVEAEWLARADRTPTDLLRAGEIAQHIGAGRGRDLIKEAASRSMDDPTILVGSYHLASTGGWEDAAEVHSWIQRAAELSGPKGPVQVATIDDLLKRKPDWEGHEERVWELLERGEIPLFAAAQALNRSLLSLYLMPALTNVHESDVRRRPFIYAFSGAREAVTVRADVVSMDATTLIALEFLNLFDECIDTFDSIVIPHSTLGWLLGEKARILFHQPSRVLAARELRTMISEGHLRVFDESAAAPEKLVTELGGSLAAFIAAASSTQHLDERQRLVVRGGPIHKISSFMQQEVDISEYQDHLCSCSTLVKKLAEKGVLTRREQESAYASLNIRERPWPTEPEIRDGAVLYLDSLSTSHLHFLGLLPKLHRAEITAFVSHQDVEEADSLISYDASAGDVVSMVDRLRVRLRESLESEKIRLGKAPRRGNDDDSPSISSHPTIDLLQLMTDSDIGVVDDRYVNRHRSITLDTTSRPIITMIDLLDILLERGAISETQQQDALTTLRRANFALTPLYADELNELVSSSNVRDGVLEETGELKAIRESIQRVQMSNMLQLPSEREWLNGVNQACLFSLREQWIGEMDEATAAARSDWLLTLADPRGWAHRLDDNLDQHMERYRNWIWMLMSLLVEPPQSVKEAYWRWFETRILESVREEDPETYEHLLTWAKEYVADSVDACEQLLETNDDQ